MNHCTKRTSYWQNRTSTFNKLNNAPGSGDYFSTGTTFLRQVTASRLLHDGVVKGLRQGQFFIVGGRQRRSTADRVGESLVISLKPQVLNGY